MEFITRVKENIAYFKASLTRLGMDRGDRIFCWCDMFASAVLHGCTPRNYIWFDFYRFNYHEKRKFLTDARALRLYKKANGKGDVRLLDDKKRFNTEYSDLIKRPWHDVKDLTPEEFASFIKECGEVIVKPYDKSWGVGVKKLSAGDIADIDPLYERYKNCLVEKRIVQHPALAAFNPDCVNSLRIVTYVCSDGKPRIAAALLRIGAAGKCADNVANGGSVAEIDIASGVVYTPAVDDGKSKHIFSPVTGAKIIGASIPHWDAIAAAALEAASRRPELRLVGWDIAVTGEGFDFIEGNSCPSIQLLQMASCTGRRDIEAAAMRSERGGA